MVRAAAVLSLLVLVGVMACLPGCQSYSSPTVSSPSVPVSTASTESPDLLPVNKVPELATETPSTATPVLWPTSTSASPERVLHTVAAGENLTSIARQYGVTPEEIRQFNQLADSDLIIEAQVLRIPTGSEIENLVTALAAASPTPTQLTGPSDEFPLSNALAEYTIPSLRNRPYDGGVITKEDLVLSIAEYEQWQVSYDSDGIYVTALMNVPAGVGPRPVIIVLHGGITQSAYTQGYGTREHCDFFARHGYLCLMPDYRSYNHTEGTGSPLKIPWTIDVMNLIAALPTLPEADSTRVGVLGHSRGGGIAEYIMVLSADVRAVSLYAPLSVDQAANWDIYVNKFGAEWPLQDAELYGSPTSNPEGYQLVSPGAFLGWVTMPVQIHHGSADGTLPVQWSRDLYEALKANGASVEYFEYDGAGHQFLGDDYGLFQQRNLEFFDQALMR